LSLTHRRDAAVAETTQRKPGDASSLRIHQPAIYERLTRKPSGTGHRSDKSLDRESATPISFQIGAARCTRPDLDLIYTDRSLAGFLLVRMESEFTK